MKAGINLEFARSEGINFEESLRQAKDAGYKFIEPYVYSSIELSINSHLKIRSTTPYHHIDTSGMDPVRVKNFMDEFGLKFSAFDVHTSLLLPQIGVPYLLKAIDFARDVNCPIVMSDEGPLPDGWMSMEKAFDIMCLSLEVVIKHAQEKGIKMAIELHNALTAKPEYLLKLLNKFSPDEIGVNFDTGNSFLAGNDPVEYLRQVADRVIHVHVKDIPESQLHERGKVTGTRVGVAAGDGVIDLCGIVKALTSVGYNGVLSVECDTLEQAKKSLVYLKGLLKRL